jgi:hypothetical protein
MKFAIIILCSVILLLLTAVLPVGKGMSATAGYYSPVFILLLALLSGCSIWCCIKRKFSAKQAGFYLVHLGVVAILVGAFIGYVAGEKGTLQLSLLPPQPTGQMLTQAGEPVELGFQVSADDFEVEFYPPIYHLYRQRSAEQIQPGEMPFEKVAEYDISGKEFLDINEVGRLAVSNLWKNGEWMPRRMLDAGSFLHRASQTPSHFGVMLKISDAGEKLDLPISINHPAGHKGWRFYLMSYDQTARRYAVLSARRDPGRNTVIAGIWATMAGMFVLCFRREGGAK